MDDSIKRQAAIDTVHKMREICDTDNIDDYEEMLTVALEELCSVQRTGHWKRYWVGTIAEGLFCDVCHKRGYGEDTCPNCDAKMESE